MEDKIKIKGKVSLQKFDELDNLIYSWEGNNLVTLDGAEVLAKLFMGDIRDQVRKCSIGYGTDTPRSTNTAATFLSLSPATMGCSSSGWNKDNASVTYNYISPSGMQLGIWREAGLVSESGTLFNRICLPEMTKQNAEYVLFSWKLSF